MDLGITLSFRHFGGCGGTFERERLAPIEGYTVNAGKDLVTA